ncbi:hypothetical protein, partial [Polymorphospora rubra]
ASSVWTEMPFMRGPIGAERLRAWLPTQRTNRTRATNRRERVLAHDWARTRLCQILQLTDARKWNGYVPPGVDEHGRPVRDERRHALIELLRDVQAADEQAAGSTE